jgi:hypothetical protein
MNAERAGVTVDEVRVQEEATEDLAGWRHQLK